MLPVYPNIVHLMILKVVKRDNRRVLAEVALDGERKRHHPAFGLLQDATL